MLIAPIILCRMDSRRLPGKVLVVAGGQCVLDQVLLRLARVRGWTSPPIIATSDRPVDDPLEAAAAERGVACVRGSADDVAGRLLSAAEAHGLAWFARINGDSPWPDPALLTQAISSRGEADFVTNLVPRSYPCGVAVELVRTASFAALVRGGMLTEPEDHEHPTRAMYRMAGALRVVHLPDAPSDADHDAASLRMTIDEPDDLERYARVLERLGPGGALASWRSAAEAYRADMAHQLVETSA